MRISEVQVEEIVGVLSKYLSSKGQLYLVGSRTHSEKKGGDIDLLLVTDSELIENLKRIKHKIVDQIKSQPSIDEAKVDLILASEEGMKSDPFLLTLKESKKYLRDIG